MEISYRRPGVDEAEAFAALHVQCWRETYADIVPAELMATFSTATRLPLWQHAVADRHRFILGAYEAGRPVGFIMSGATEEKLIENQDGHIWALYIAAAQHKHGIGRHLVAQAAADWFSRGGTTMTVGVFAENKPARAFYEKIGAEIVRQGTYRWDGHDLPDCIYFWHDLAKLAKL